MCLFADMSRYRAISSAPSSQRASTLFLRKPHTEPRGNARSEGAGDQRSAPSELFGANEGHQHQLHPSGREIQTDARREAPSRFSIKLAKNLPPLAAGEGQKASRNHPDVGCRWVGTKSPGLCSLRSKQFTMKYCSWAHATRESTSSFWAAVRPFGTATLFISPRIFHPRYGLTSPSRTLSSSPLRGYCVRSPRTYSM